MQFALLDDWSICKMIMTCLNVWTLYWVCQGQETGAYMWSYLGWCGRLAHTIEFSDFFFFQSWKQLELHNID